MLGSVLGGLVGVVVGEGLGRESVGAVVSIRTTSAVAVTGSPFLGVNIDAASLYQGVDRDSRPHRLDFADEGLIDVAARFCSASPDGAFLRIGGSAADDLAFIGNGMSFDEAAEAFPDQSIFVEEEYWDSLAKFVDSTNCSLIFDLNGMSFRAADGSWNATNAESLLRYAASTATLPSGLQLANEPGHWWTRHFPNGTWGDALGTDFHTLRELLGTIPGGEDILLFGPDVAPRPLPPDQTCVDTAICTIRFAEAT